MDFVVALLTLAFVVLVGSFIIAWIYNAISEMRDKQRSACHPTQAITNTPAKKEETSNSASFVSARTTIEREKYATIFERDDTFSSFFKDLFEKISFIKKCTTLHQQIDYILYALFKSRVIFSCALMLQERPENKCRVIMQEYDLFQYLAFFDWMHVHAPAFEEYSDIADSRLLAYEKVLNECTAPSLSIAMIHIGDTLHWFFENGWKKGNTGELSNIPTDNFDLLQMFKDSLTDSFKHLRKQHQQIHDEFDSTLITYCDERIAQLVNLI